MASSVEKRPLTPSSEALDALWQAPTLIRVVLIGEALALIVTLAPNTMGDPVPYFAMASLVIQWVFLTTLGILYLMRRRLAGASPVTVARIALGALLIGTWLIAAVAWSVLHEIWPPPHGGWTTFTLRLTTIALTVGLLGLAAFRSQWRERQLAVRAKQAEIDALQARIRPHFLFNALNTGIALVHARPEATEQLLLDLSDLFRAAISGKEQVHLEEELSLTRRYLEIESLRFCDRLEVRWDIASLPDHLRKVGIPPLSVQPLVENAIKHGIEPSKDSGIVSVSLKASRDQIVIEVRNSMPSGHSSSSAGHGIGLKAVRSRIRSFTNGEGQVKTYATGGEHIATLTLPLHR